MKKLSKIRKQTARATLFWQHLAWLPAGILALSFHAAMAEENSAFMVQDALKKQQFYFGELTGVVDDATRSALRRFQIRHGLPISGRIDDATIEKLLGHPAASAPPVGAVTPGPGPAPQLQSSVVEKDREFLQKVEAGTEATAPIAQVAPPPTRPGPPVAVSRPPETPAPSRAAPAVTPMPTFIEMNARLDAPRKEAPKPATASRKVEKPQTAQSRSVQGAREARPEPIASGPPRRPEVRTSAPAPLIVADQKPEPLPAPGTTVTRTTTTSIGPDGRTYIHEKKTTTVVTDKPTPEPRRKASGFKLFGDDD